MSTEQTSACAGLSERTGGQVVVLVEICFISNDISGIVSLSGRRAGDRAHLGLQSASFYKRDEMAGEVINHLEPSGGAGGVGDKTSSSSAGLLVAVSSHTSGCSLAFSS